MDPKCNAYGVPAKRRHHGAEGRLNGLLALTCRRRRMARAGQIIPGARECKHRMPCRVAASVVSLAVLLALSGESRPAAAVGKFPARTATAWWR